MKREKLEAIKTISFDRKTCTGPMYDVKIEVVPGMATTNTGYHNFLTRVTLEPNDDRTSKDPEFKAVHNLLFLDSYGDDMPESVRKHIFVGDASVVGVIDMDTQEFHWGRLSSEKKYGSILALCKMGVLRKENSYPGELLPKDFPLSMRRKRPYHFEINWWYVEQFLEGEEGWSHLRDGLKAVVHCGDTRYVTGYDEDEDDE